MYKNVSRFAGAKIHMCGPQWTICVYNAGHSIQTHDLKNVLMETQTFLE